MTVVQKLAFFFSLLLLILILSGAISYSRILNVEHVVKELAAIEEPLNVSMLNIQNKINQYFLSVLKYIDFHEELYKEEMEVLGDEISENLLSFHEMARDDSEKTLGRKVSSLSLDLKKSGRRLQQTAEKERELLRELKQSLHNIRSILNSSEQKEEYSGHLKKLDMLYSDACLYVFSRTVEQDLETDTSGHEELLLNDLMAIIPIFPEAEPILKNMEKIFSQLRLIHSGRQLEFDEFHSKFQSIQGYLDGVVQPLVNARIVGIDQQAYSVVESTRNTLIFLLSLGLVFGVIGSGVLRRSIAAPMHQLFLGTEKIGKGQLDHRLEIRGRDEFAQLGQRFNEMAENLSLAHEEIRLLQEVVEQSPHSTMIADKNGIVRYVNPIYSAFTGYMEQDVLGKHASEVGEAWAEEGTAHKNELMTDGRLYAEVQKETRNGEYYWEGFTVFYLKDQKGEPTHIVKLARDMTREKIIEEERKSLEEQLQKSKQLETIGRLAGGVAHDFNNILTSILGYTEIAMMDAPKGSLLRENLDEVLTAGKRGRSLVRQILTFSQRSVQKMAPLDVNQILEEALKTLKPHIPPHLDLQCSIEPHLGKIMGDATNMHQVISNLCMNAIHAMETQAEAKLKVSLSLFIQDGSMEQYFLEIGEYICLEVEDNGPGMSAEIKAKIFEPFFTTKKNGKGTGLGLSVVHGVVKKHHGEILVESELGKGTRFVLYFPKLERSVAELSSQVAEIHSS